MTRPDTVAIVLAGGASSRFGGDKLAAELDGAPLLHHALRAVATVADEIVLVLAPGADVPAPPGELGSRVRVARDAEAYGGPLAGLAAGLGLVPDAPPRIVLVVAGDMPRLVPAVLRALADHLAAEPGVAAMTLAASEMAPLPLALRPQLVRRALAANLAAGRRSLRSLLASVRLASVAAATWRALDPAGETLRDVDTTADLEVR